MRRRIVVRADDVLVVDGMEIDAHVLKAIIDPSNRLLWIFVRSSTGVQPIALSEERVIWLQDEDLVRTELPAAV